MTNDPETANWNRKIVMLPLFLENHSKVFLRDINSPNYNFALNLSTVEETKHNSREKQN